MSLGKTLEVRENENLKIMTTLGPLELNILS